MSTFSTRLKIALDNKGIKPSVLAYRCGIHQSTITNYLKGRYEPKTEMVLKICEVLDCNAEWLSGYSSPSMQEKSSPEEPKLSEGEKMLVDMFRAIPEEQQKVFLEMGRVYANSLKKD